MGGGGGGGARGVAGERVEIQGPPPGFRLAPVSTGWEEKVNSWELPARRMKRAERQGHSTDIYQA